MADKQTLANLQTSAQLLAHLSAQYRVDVRQLHAMGLKWLQKCVKKWYKGSEDQLDVFIDRILYYGADPEYEVGDVAGANSIEDILNRAKDMVDEALEQFIEFRQAAWEVRPDYTVDVYEHAIEEMEKQSIKLARELQLIKQLTLPGYIGARLEDAA